jgi:hypothetical protein
MFLRNVCELLLNYMETTPNDSVPHSQFHGNLKSHKYISWVFAVANLCSEMRAKLRNVQQHMCRAYILNNIITSAGICGVSIFRPHNRVKLSDN